MIWPEPMASAPGLIQVHAAAALLAVGLGVVVLARAKGTRSHKAWGWAWIATMAVAAGTAIFIHEGSGITILGFGPFGLIHALIVLTVLGIAQGVWHARRGSVALHRSNMRTVFLLSLVTAGAFTLLPGRRMAQVLFGDNAALAVAALLALLALAAALGWRWSREDRQARARQGTRTP